MGQAVGRRDPFGALLAGLSSLGTGWIFVLMFVILADVVGRTAFSSPVPGVPELVSLSIVGIVFLQLAHTVRSGQITRVTAVTDWLENHSPRVAAVLMAVYDLCGAGLFLVLVSSLWPPFVRAWATGEYAGVEGYVAYPIWPVKLIIVVGCACSAVQFAIQACRHIAAVGNASRR
jgi:TRAP-type mannitol/chloroaromatic compound transport system permease small subunit